MTPERVILAALTVAVAYLGYEVSRIVIEDEQAASDYQRALAEWRGDLVKPIPAEARWA